MWDTSFPVLPIPDHAFFEQAVFQREVRDGLLERGGLSPKALHLGAGRLTGSIAGQTPSPGFEELLGPGIIQALGYAFASAELSDAVIAAQPHQHDPDLLFGRMALARLAADVSDNTIRRRFWCSGFHSHLHSLVVTMSLKSSVTQSRQNGPRALTGDTWWHVREARHGGQRNTDPYRRSCAVRRC
jgi:hypothetical protein